ncbi:MAG: hypothetical protein FJ387_29085 [Verrucomicrobia bacterium]|nr:hypothetical protein [Verrucomicrobiota bacterium]
MSGCDGKIPCLGELAPGQVLAPKGTARTPPACDFAEARVWEALGGGWHCLNGCYCQHGVSVEWHDFTCDKPRDWAWSFHPGSVELCLNLSGHARLTCRKELVLLSARTIALYAPADQELSAWRLPGERHRFLTVEYSPSFLERPFQPGLLRDDGLLPWSLSLGLDPIHRHEAPGRDPSRQRNSPTIIRNPPGAAQAGSR